MGAEKGNGDADGNERQEQEHQEHIIVQGLQVRKKTLGKNDNNIAATARALGMHRRTLQRKLQKRPAKN